MLDYKEYVYTVYQERSFSKAARKLFVSQPWLSSTVKKVEQELNLQLFDRSTNPISLTEAGKYYIENVERIMAIEDEMQQHFQQMSMAGASIHIGSSMFFCTYVLPRLMGEFCAMYPQVKLTFSEGNSATLSNSLLDGKLDFLLEVEKPSNSQIQTMAWASEELVLAVPAKYDINRELSAYCYTFNEFLKRNEPGGKKPAVPLQQFQKQQFLMLKPDNDSYLRGIQICQNAGFFPNISLFLTQMMTTYYLVCEGQGIAFLRSTIPEYVAPTDSIVFYQLDDALAERNIYLSYVKNRQGDIQNRLQEFMREKRLVGENHSAT